MFFVVVSFLVGVVAAVLLQFFIKFTFPEVVCFSCCSCCNCAVLQIIPIVAVFVAVVATTAHRELRRTRKSNFLSGSPVMQPEFSIRLCVCKNMLFAIHL